MKMAKNNNFHFNIKETTKNDRKFISSHDLIHPKELPFLAG